MDDVEKVEFFLESKKQRIYIEISNAKLATLGVTATELIAILQTQNAVVKGGTFESPKENAFALPYRGRYHTLADLKRHSNSREKRKILDWAMFCARHARL